VLEALTQYDGTRPPRSVTIFAPNGVGLCTGPPSSGPGVWSSHRGRRITAGPAAGQGQTCECWAVSTDLAEWFSARRPW
jgi:hypothetical protein